MKIITNPDTFTPQPNAFNESPNQFFNSFRNGQTEVSAAWLLELAQQRGNWAPFSLEDLGAIYAEADKFNFRDLIPKGYIVGHPL